MFRRYYITWYHNYLESNEFYAARTIFQTPKNYITEIIISYKLSTKDLCETELKAFAVNTTYVEIEP